jgi:hypothetical protein
MHVHAFRGTGRVFGFTMDATGSNLPTQYAPWSPFKTLDLTRGSELHGVRVDECLDDIDQHGIHLTEAHVRITDRVI